jgi:hypothetical protein
MPWLEVNGESTRTLVATLIDIASSVVVNAEHRDEAVGRAIGAANVRASGADTMYVETNTAGGLGNQRTGLECVIDTIDAVLLHVDEEA